MLACELKPGMMVIDGHNAKDEIIIITEIETWRDKNIGVKRTSIRWLNTCGKLCFYTTYSDRDIEKFFFVYVTG